jgi:hypothetical protein
MNSPNARQFCVETAPVVNHNEMLLIFIDILHVVKFFSAKTVNEDQNYAFQQSYLFKPSRHGCYVNSHRLCMRPFASACFCMGLTVAAVRKRNPQCISQQFFSALIINENRDLRRLFM